MRVSFVIPSFNQAPFIGRCIDRCLLQQLGDPSTREIIVMDGGSTDGTVDILKSYRDMIRWHSEPDAGQADAVNKGIGMASGDVIAWINSDDFYPDGTVLPKVLRAFDEHDVQFVHGRGMIVGPDGRRFCAARTRAVHTARDLIVRPGNEIFQPTAFFLRRVFLEVGGLDVNLHYAMDLDLWLRMLPGVRVHFIDDVLACATSHAGAKTRARIRASIAEVYRVKRRHAGRHGLTMGERMRMRAGEVREYTYWLAVTLGLRRLPRA